MPTFRWVIDDCCPIHGYTRFAQSQCPVAFAKSQKRCHAQILISREYSLANIWSIQSDSVLQKKAVLTQYMFCTTRTIIWVLLSKSSTCRKKAYCYSVKSGVFKNWTLAHRRHTNEALRSFAPWYKRVGLYRGVQKSHFDLRSSDGMLLLYDYNSIYCTTTKQS